MYAKGMVRQMSIELPFNMLLNSESRWVKLAELLPWARIEAEYIKYFRGREGQMVKSARLAFGALYIQTAEGFTDEQTRLHIQENPHMQYFCGLSSYSPESPFDASMMVHFRKRISADMVQAITQEVFKADAISQTDVTDTFRAVGDKAADVSIDNSGTLILDATCCPQDIHYPTDIGLLNHSREITENIIDVLYKSVMDQYAYKPRTYRHVARQDYTEYTKIRKPSYTMTRKHLRKQLQYMARNLRIIEDLVENRGADLGQLNRQLYRKLLIVQEVFRQQKEMYDTKSYSCDARIVSTSQPHVRPIVLSKENVPTEFGTKIAIGLVGGYAFITCLPWENIPEGSVLQDAAEQFRAMFGFYPKSIIGDHAYSHHNNHIWCDMHGIHLYGTYLERKMLDQNSDESKQVYINSREQNVIEGDFSAGDRKYGSDRIMAKLPDTSYTAIAMGVFAANLERKLRLLLSPDSYCRVSYNFEDMRLYIQHIKP